MRGVHGGAPHGRTLCPDGWENGWQRPAGEKPVAGRDNMGEKEQVY